MPTAVVFLKSTTREVGIDCLNIQGIFILQMVNGS
jgi:hypothetical protein